LLFNITTDRARERDGKSKFSECGDTRGPGVRQYIMCCITKLIHRRIINKFIPTYSIYCSSQNALNTPLILLVFECLEKAAYAIDVYIVNIEKTLYKCDFSVTSGFSKV
jgi:hypothetical protein